MEPVTRLTIISKPDCHLCDVAREIVETVVAGLPDDAAEALEIEELSIVDDEVLYAQWWEKIPVVLIDGQLQAALMIRYGVGVQVKETYRVIEIDEDFFA